MSRRFTLPAVVAIILGAVAAYYRLPPSVPETPIVPGQVQVFFSPRGGCADAIVANLRRARKSIHVQAYSFTNKVIAEALLEAHRRGVEVEVILDSSNETDRYSAADFLARAGIPTFLDPVHARARGIAHNKVMLLDGATIITGSFNFTKAAEEKNAENLLIFHETPALAAKYEANYQQHRTHSEKYVSP